MSKQRNTTPRRQDRPNRRYRRLLPTAFAAAALAAGAGAAPPVLAQVKDHRPAVSQMAGGGDRAPDTIRRQPARGR